MQIVNIIDFSRPNLAFIIVLVVEMAFQKDIHLFAQNDCFMIFSCDCHIEQRYEFDSLSFEKRV